MQFFLPDWDDRVDPGFDFRTERFTLDRDPYRDDLYGHEVFPERIYDGLLVSRMALGETGPKREWCERVGMRRYLRLPTDLVLFGDCGAYGYLRDTIPRFDPVELAAYYERLGFDYGASVDHIIVPQVAASRQARYEVTLRNAARFLDAHRVGGYRFIPVGSLQGWDQASYLAATDALVAMGYDYLAVGGLARSPTEVVRRIVTAVRERVPSNVRIHVFGIARMSLLPEFQLSGIASVDSAAPLRHAWLSPHDNYYTSGRTYIAIRIPIAVQERPKSGTLVARSQSRLSELVAAEKHALAMMRAYDRGAQRLAATLAAIMDYDHVLADRVDGQRRERRASLYGETLRDRPWKNCPCPVCRDLGVEVIIFRGNNRNRRRGFHNLWMTHQQLTRLGSDRGDGGHVPEG